MRPENPEDPSKIHQLVEDIKSYIHTNYELYKLKAVDKIASGLSSVTTCIVMVLLFVWVFVLASIGGALWLNEQVGDRFSGFFIMAGAYLVIALVIYTGRERLITKKIANSIINHFIN